MIMLHTSDVYGTAGEPNYDLAHLPEMLKLTKPPWQNRHQDSRPRAGPHPDNMDVNRYEPHLSWQLLWT
jgi:hypothetical protein